MKKEPEGQKKGRSLRDWMTRRTVVSLFVFGVGTPLLYLWWQNFRNPEPIRFSSETTVVTEPRTADGRYIDYCEHLLDNVGRHDVRNDLWIALLRRDSKKSYEETLAQVPDAVLIDPWSLRPKDRNEKSFSDFETRHDARATVPFTEVDDPEYAAIVDQNEPWYQAMMSVDPGPAGIAPDRSAVLDRAPMQTVRLPCADAHHPISDAFQQRAMLAAGRGDFDRVVESASLIERAAARERRLPFFADQRVAQQLQRDAVEALATSILHLEQLSDMQLAAAMAVFPDDTYVPPLSVMMNERLVVLDIIQECHQLGISDWWSTRSGWGAKSVRFEDGFLKAFSKHGFDGAVEWMGENRVRSKIDWNAVLRAVNDFYPNWKDAWLKDSYSERRAAFDELYEPLFDREHELGEFRLPKPWRGNTEDYTRRAVNTAVRHFQYSMSAACAEQVNAVRYLRIVVRLHVYRREHGRFPLALDDLRLLPGWEAPNDTAFLDAFSERPFQYRCTSEGFVLWSVGPDLKDDTGTAAEPGDVQGGSDDFVWSWPVD